MWVLQTSERLNTFDKLFFLCLNEFVVPMNNRAIKQEEYFIQNVSPIDGRYRQQLDSLRGAFSEYAYIHQRIHVEIEYLIFLSKNGVIKKLDKSTIHKLRIISDTFSTQDAQKIKNIEKSINHDMKAIEYFLQEKCKELQLDSLIPFIHWGITSDDTGNLAYGIALNQNNNECIIPTLETLLQTLRKLSNTYKKSLFLARTHGQPAVPTTFGKEIANFSVRLHKQYNLIKGYEFDGKLMGAVGNLNAHKLFFPSINWIEKSKLFVASLGLKPNIYTTQILPYDNWVSYFQILMNINNIVRGLCVDMWTYITLEEVKLKKKTEEVGSSTMPQKVNPIDFENAEGNCEIANTYYQLFERKLLQSRLQRDLSDSVVKRTFGTALAHTILAWNSLQKGLSKIGLDDQMARTHITDHYEVLAEAIQTYLRLKNDTTGYEKVKKMTRGKKMTKILYQTIVRELHLEALENLSPEQYVGYSEELAQGPTL